MSETTDGQLWIEPGATQWAEIKPAPLIFVQDPHYVTETKTPPDPWCLSCGARIAPKGLPVHARWHGWQPENYEVASHDELAARGL